MEKFTKIPAKITAKGLENTDVDVKRREIQSAQIQRHNSSKHYERQNKMIVRDTENYVRYQNTNKSMAKAKEVAWKKNQGKIPAYLQKRRQEEEQESQRTKYEIMMNKGRSENTRTVTQDERDRVLDDLEQRKAYLDKGIQNMSVTLYTTRAQNQRKGYIENLNEVERAMTVFERNKVFVNE